MIERTLGLWLLSAAGPSLPAGAGRRSAGLYKDSYPAGPARDPDLGRQPND